MSEIASRNNMLEKEVFKKIFDFERNNFENL